MADNRDYSTLGLYVRNVDFSKTLDAMDGIDYWQREWEEEVQQFEDRDPESDLAELKEETDQTFVKYMTDLVIHPELEDREKWSKLMWGKIYKEGFYGELMWRVGEWKYYRFGSKMWKRLPRDWFYESKDGFMKGIPQYDFVRGQKMPHADADRHMRFRRTFHHLSRDSNAMRARAAEKPNKKTRQKGGEMANLHPRVEEAMSAMFEEMSRNRVFDYNEENDCI